MSTRPAAVANLFYPGDPDVLHNDIQRYLAAVSPVHTTPKAIIVPHAGYIYSGQVAASAYAQLLAVSSQITRVVLLGPCHRVAVEGLAVPSVDYFETPLGKIPLDHAAIDKILQLPQVNEFNLTHEQEHSLEVQLPFLQETLENFSLVPLVVGDASTASVQQVIDTLWGGDETLIVISSDLSHYHDYATAKAIDTATCNAIENFDASSIHYENACGRTPVTALLASAKARNMHVTTLDLRNSGDTAGDKSRVVGYGAWMFDET
jgi:hypothetical protein